jgi:hypothetical protein
VSSYLLTYAAAPAATQRGDRLGSFVCGVDDDPVPELADQLADGADALKYGLIAGLPVQA